MIVYVINVVMIEVIKFKKWDVNVMLLVFKDFFVLLLVYSDIF